MPAKYTESEIIAKIRNAHGDAIGLQDFVYNGSFKQSVFHCKIHGRFLSTPRRVIGSTKGCLICNEQYRKERSIAANSNSFEKVQQQVLETHGVCGKVRLVGEFTTMGTPALFNCRIHGDYYKRPHDAISQRQGCPECGKESRGDKLRMSQEDFLSRAAALHPSLDFSEFVCIGSKDKSKVICPVHGEFSTTPFQLLTHKRGCKFCSGYKGHTATILSRIRQALADRYDEEFASKFDLSNVVYTDNQSHITIGCPKHGDFHVSPANLFRGRGCPTCGQGQRVSRGEQLLVDTLSRLFHNIEILQHDRSVITPREIDILLPEYSVGIEHHGITYHSEQFVSNTYHLEKYEAAKENGCRLLQVFSDELEQKTHIVLSIILSALGEYAHTLYARKTKVVELDQSQYREFTLNNHIQGYRPAKVCIGLVSVDSGELVSCMSFQNNELARFCNDTYTNVVGGFSKLLKYYLREYQPKQDIISYCDKRYFTGNVYEQNGFVLSGSTRPNYWYVIDKHTRESRQKWQKHKLKNKLEIFDPNLTEVQNMQNNGYFRVFDCGHFKYTFSI